MKKMSKNGVIVRVKFSNKNIIVNVGIFKINNENRLKFKQKKFSTGHFNFKKTNRSGFFATQILIERVTNFITELNLPVILIITGINPFKNYIIKQFMLGKFLILRIIDNTKTPHNGCRFKK